MRIKLCRRLALLLCCSMFVAVAQSGCAADTEYMAAADPSAVESGASTPALPPEQPGQLDQLVAPIALYPDALVAQILAASTFPTEIVEAERWMRQHPSLKGQPLAEVVDQQPWDASVKALTQFPVVLTNMDQNLSWTSALGDAYANQPQDVMTAVQAMRQRARQAGNLQSTPQETVSTQGQAITIEPVNPEIVYVPEYDPWLVYGAPVVAYPGWVPVPGLFIDGPGFAWGLSFGIVAGFGWGWHHWGADWHDHRLDFDHRAYASHSPTFAHGGFHGAGFHGFVGPYGRTAMRSGAFSGFDHGGFARAYASRGASSLGGFHGGFAGGFHGGGFGGFHGGGGHR